jgi:uncharacterized protein YraI
VKVRTLAAAAMAVALLGAAAHAEPSFTTANVNLRTGPDIDFPSVGVIPEGDDIFVKGCLRDESWCDVQWGPDRGWVYSEFIAFDYRGETRPLPDIGVAAFGIPFVTFVAADYWGHYYVGRPWWRERARWFAYTPRVRVGWHAPPPGPRVPGWWRAGYVAPHGMHAPPGAGWHRPVRAEHREIHREIRREMRHREERREHRRDDRHDDHH